MLQEADLSKSVRVAPESALSLLPSIALSSSICFRIAASTVFSILMAVNLVSMTARSRGISKLDFSPALAA
jgi:hypothetical protein